LIDLKFHHPTVGLFRVLAHELKNFSLPDKAEGPVNEGMARMEGTREPCKKTLKKSSVSGEMVGDMLVFM
jgi:hypothetical protein